MERPEDRKSRQGRKQCYCIVWVGLQKVFALYNVVLRVRLLGRLAPGGNETFF
jgi:hypothetical protein